MKLAAISWFILITILFMLPGSSLPKENWFSDLHVDKWVHVGFLAVLVFLWSGGFRVKTGWKLILAALAYGLLIEWIQKTYIPNRGFDIWDVVADGAGSLLGWFLWSRVYKKNRPL